MSAVVKVVTEHNSQAQRDADRDALAAAIPAQADYWEMAGCADGEGVRCVCIISTPNLAAASGFIAEAKSRVDSAAHGGRIHGSADGVPKARPDYERVK
jgi:hypothetical protein